MSKVKIKIRKAKRGRAMKAPAIHVPAVVAGCVVCGRAWADHPGIATTCAINSRLATLNRLMLEVLRRIESACPRHRAGRAARAAVRFVEAHTDA